MHHCKLVLFCVVTVFLTLAWGLNKPVVKLGSSSEDKTYNYITLGKLDDDDEPYTLMCAFEMDEGEELKGVTWFYNKIGNIVFDWSPNQDPVVHSFLVNRVNMTRKDGNINFLERHREYEGLYFCQVTTSTAMKPSDSFQLVTADLGSRVYQSKSSAPDKNCVMLVSLSTPAIYPEPEAEYGVWDGANWIKKVPLIPQRHSNGSVQFSLQNREFQVDKFPEGAELRLAIGFMIAGEYVPLWTETSSVQRCTPRDDNSDNGHDDNGDNGDDHGDNGNDKGGDDTDGAASHPVSLAASAAVVLCFLYVNY